MPIKSIKLSVKELSKLMEQIFSEIVISQYPSGAITYTCKSTEGWEP
jgi:hypothetical protein